MDEQTKLFIEISRNLGEINSKMGNLCETIAKHESRISELEKEQRSDPSDWKREIIGLLVKALIVGAVGITTLAGGGSILIKLLGA